MYRIRATLPTLGNIAVDFHAESEVIAKLFGVGEWDRLRSIPHLGVAASVFTGVHHSRLEYVLLQCAVTSLVAKLHRNDEQLALSGKVSLNGLKPPVSSGEELLKCWIILSNFGHAQYTYGIERSLLQKATEDVAVRDWLTVAIRPRDLREWSQRVVSGYSYPEFRYILILRRIAQLPRWDRRKGVAVQYLRNLLLDPDQLFPASSAVRHKLGRLRQLFARIRLLSMVALDAHYSHHPISFNVNSAIIGLAELAPSGVARMSGFDELLRRAAGWLADELYLHPTACAAQKEYELRFASRFPARFKNSIAGNRLHQLLHELMTQGLGPPRPSTLMHLVRMSFSLTRPQLLRSSTHFETSRQLAKELTSPPYSYVSIDNNSFTQGVHVDLFYRANTEDFVHIARIYTKLQRWLVRALEADTLARIRRIFVRPGKEQIQRSRERDFARQMDRYAGLFQEIFDSVLRILLHENHKCVIAEFEPLGRMSVPVLAKFKLSDGTVIDTVTARLAQVLRENPGGLPAERLQEIRCVVYALERSNAAFTLVCPEKLIIKDQHGAPIDEWDGVLIEISETSLVITVVEGKSGGTARAREEAAFKQLLQTRKLLTSRFPIRSRRKRIPRLGALLHLFSTT